MPRQRGLVEVTPYSGPNPLYQHGDLPAPVQWRWFNPATGDAVEGQAATERIGQKTFERPARWEDAVLVLRQASGR
jgi:hypothetical protein